MNTKIAGMIVLFISLVAIPYSISAQTECPTAPTPQLVIGQQGNVTPGPANNVRDLPSRDGASIGEIPGAGIFIVLDGPVCDGEIYWWKVDYDGLIGWTAEGKNNAYWVVPIAATPTPTATQTMTSTHTPTALPTATPTAIPLVIEKIVEVPYDGTISYVEYSPDGSMIAATLNNVVRIMDAETLDIIVELNLEDISNMPSYIFAIAWHPDSQQIAIPFRDRFQIYSIPDAQVIWEKMLPHYVNTIDPQDGKEEIFPQRMTALQFTPDGSRLFTFADDGIVRGWDYGADEASVAINARDLRLEGRRGGWAESSDLIISPDGSRLAFAFTEYEIVVWNLELSGPLQAPPDVPYDVDLAFAIDASELYYHNRDSEIYIYDLTTNEQQTISIEGSVRDIQIHPNNNWVAYSIAREGQDSLIIADRTSLAQRADIMTTDSNLRAFAFSPDGTRIVIVDGFEYVTIWSNRE